MRFLQYPFQGSVEAVQWLPSDSGVFVSGGADRRVNFWDANQLRPADTFQMEGKVHCVHMSKIAGHQVRRGS